MGESECVERVWREFWLPIVSERGEIDIEQVKRELYDWHAAMREVSVVYEEITGGRLSKPNYVASEVISLANEHYQQFTDEAVAEAVQAERERVTSLEEENEKLRAKIERLEKRVPKKQPRPQPDSWRKKRSQARRNDGD